MTVSLQGPVSIGTLVHQAQHERSWDQRVSQEPYDGNCQQYHFVSHYIQKVERNVLHNGHQLLVLGQSVLQSFSQSKQPSQWWLHMFLVIQSCWMHWVPHATVCVQGTYVVCSSNGIQWSSGTYPLRGEIMRLVVEWTSTLVEFHHSYDDFDHLES